MTYYLSLFSALIIIQLIPVSSEKTNKIRLLFSFLLLFIYAAIRIDFGLDYTAYEDIYYNSQSSIELSLSDSSIELGYLWLNRIMPSHRLLIIALSAFTCLTYYILFIKYIPIKYYWFGLLLLALSGNTMLFFQLSGLRNAIVINLLTLSLPLIKDRRILLFSALTLIAYYFHRSAVFFMPIAYFAATPHKFKRQSIVIWSTVILIFLTLSTMQISKQLAPIISRYFERYTHYMINASDTTFEGSALLYGFVFLVFSISFFVLYKGELIKEELIILKLSLLFFLSIVLGPLNLRMSQYFAPYLVLASIIVMRRMKEPVLKYSYVSAVLLFLIYSFFVVFMGSEYYSYEKFTTIFNK